MRYDWDWSNVSYWKTQHTIFLLNTNRIIQINGSLSFDGPSNNRYSHYRFDHYLKHDYLLHLFHQLLYKREIAKIFITRWHRAEISFALYKILIQQQTDMFMDMDICAVESREWSGQLLWYWYKNIEWEGEQRFLALIDYKFLTFLSFHEFQLLEVVYIIFHQII